MPKAFIAVDALETTLVLDMLAEEPTGASVAKVALPDGQGEYELAGFVSHMGASTAAGRSVLVSVSVCAYSSLGPWKRLLTFDRLHLNPKP